MRIIDIEGKALDRKKAGNKSHGIKVAAVIAAAVIVCVVVVYTAICFFTAKSLISPERRELSYMCIIDHIDELGIICEPFSVNGVRDGDVLRGWWIPAQTEGDEFEITDNSKTVIFSHNYQSNREMNEISGMFMAKYLIRAGYNVIVFDYSGCGTSSGKNYTLGAEETDELALIVRYASETRLQRHIAVMGWGFGAAAAVNEGATDGLVEAVIADSSYLDLEKYLDTDLGVWTGINDKLFNTVTKFFMDMLTDNRMKNSSPLDAVRNSEAKSYLFLHGDSDSVFPSENSRVLYSAAEKNNNAEIEIFHSTLHIYGFMTHEEQYMNTVIDFLDKYLGADVGI